jgi:hypothetical protein
LQVRLRRGSHRLLTSQWAKAVVIRFAYFNQRIEEKWYMFI